MAKRTNKQEVMDALSALTECQIQLERESKERERLQAEKAKLREALVAVNRKLAVVRAKYSIFEIDAVLDLIDEALADQEKG